MDIPTTDFFEARKVSLVTLETEVKPEVEPLSGDDEPLRLETLEKDYFPTGHLLQVRDVAYAVQDEDDRFMGPQDGPKTLNERLYAEAIAGKEASEREKADALLDKHC